MSDPIIFVNVVVVLMSLNLLVIYLSLFTDSFYPYQVTRTHALIKIIPTTFIVVWGVIILVGG